MSAQVALVLLASIFVSSISGIDSVKWSDQLSSTRGGRRLQANWHPSRFKKAQQAPAPAAWQFSADEILGNETQAVPVNHALDERDDARECLTYRMQPAENTWEHSEDKTITKNRVAPIKCGHRKFQDFPKLAYAIWNSEGSVLAEDSVAMLRKLPEFKTADVQLWMEGKPKDLNAEAKQAAALWSKILVQENHFMIWSTSVLGEARAFNRMVKFAQNAELVVLARDHDMAAVTPHWLQRVRRAFQDHPALAIVGGAIGKVVDTAKGHVDHGGEPVTTTRGFELVEEVLGGPLVVRRDYFLALGLFALPHCHTDCAPHFESEFSARAWIAGYEAAVVPTDTIAVPKVRCSDTGGVEPRWRYSNDQHDRIKTNVQDSIQEPKPAPKRENCLNVPTPKPPKAPEHCMPYPDDYPRAALMVQYFRRPNNVNAIMKGLRLSPESVEVMVNNDSGGDHVVWRRQLNAANQFLIYSHDIHEIRAYNRMGLMANSEHLVTLQDDDAPATTTWLTGALKLFEAHPRLIYMTGYRARAGHPGGNVGLGRGKLPMKDPVAKEPFMFAYKLVAGPLHLRRSVWLELGLFNMNFSCAGDPGIHFEYEYSIRTWWRDYQAGIYDCKFKHHIGDWKGSGTRANKKSFSRRTEIGKRNSANVKFMYRGLHGNGDAVLPRKAGLVQQLYQKGKLYQT